MRAFAFIMALACANAGAATTMGLKDALRYALQHSPSLEQDRQREKIGEWTYSSTKAKLLPSLDLDSSHGLQKSHIAASPTEPWTSSLSLALTENLYDNGETLNNIEINRLSRDASALTVKKSRDSLLADVAAEFYRYSLAKKLIDTRVQQRELVTKQFRLVSSQYEQGFKTKKDFLRFSAQVKKAEIDYRNAVIDAETRATNLKNLLGVPSDSFGTGELTFEVLEPKALDLRTPTADPPVDNTYEVRIARLQTDQQPFQVRIAERRFWPNLNITGGLNYTNGSYLGPNAVPWGSGENYSASAQVQLKFNLLDWGTRRRDIAVAESTKLIQDHEFRKVQLLAAQSLRTLMLQLGQYRDNYELSKSLLDAQEQSFVFVKRDYDEGKVTSTDLIQNLSELLEARTTYFNAQYILAENIARYHYYLGDLYATLSLE